MGYHPGPSLLVVGRALGGGSRRSIANSQHIHADMGEGGQAKTKVDNAHPHLIQNLILTLTLSLIKIFDEFSIMLMNKWEKYNLVQ